MSRAHDPGRSGWRWLGVPVEVERSWGVIAALVTWTLATGYFPLRVPGFPPAAHWAMGLAATLLLFLSILLHELGHALVAKRHGIRVARVTLFLFGGVAEIAHDPRRPSVELRMALAGPLVSALIAGGCAALVSRLAFPSGPATLAVRAVVEYLALINTALLVFNLLPGFPLDGGRVLRALLWVRLGSLRRATRITGALGVLLGLGLMAVGAFAVLRGAWVGGVWYILLGFFLRRAARLGAQQAERPS